ncbi:GNAT family N-acetyltransferase [Leptolyngbya sp. FACHB-36]|uniref:GNAT family N-acetyltransferase n=1 Tax=Leptolyngbya sp. FACHB-36 TaxID=2692808 RepID=UPI0016816DB0|nr:N-acetyltransferase [Leptolyngbya sp. FACHB-36]MBD2020332.1 GNAT family N-acetyltransferase [Leptolyngbya sp. FACHB-36]
MTLTIRSAQPDDLVELVEILHTSFYSNTGICCWLQPLLRLGMYEDMRQRLQKLSTSHQIILVAIAESNRDARQSQIVGTVEIDLLPVPVLPFLESHSPYVSNLAVKREYRRQGIAQRLLAACEQIAIEQGFQNLYLHVQDKNDVAKQLYTKVGYSTHKPTYSWQDWQPWRFGKMLLHKQLDALSKERHRVI